MTPRRNSQTFSRKFNVIPHKNASCVRYCVFKERETSVSIEICITSSLIFRKVQNAGHRLQVTGQVTGHRTQVTGHRTGHRTQVTGHRSQITRVTKNSMKRETLHWAFHVYFHVFHFRLRHNQAYIFAMDHVVRFCTESKTTKWRMLHIVLELVEIPSLWTETRHF